MIYIAATHETPQPEEQKLENERGEKTLHILYQILIRSCKKSGRRAQEHTVHPFLVFILQCWPLALLFGNYYFQCRCFLITLKEDRPEGKFRKLCGLYYAPI